MGHKCIALSCSDGSAVCICLKGKAFSTGGYVRYLNLPCNVKPHCPRSSKHYWNRILAGKHPKSDRIWLDVDALSVARLFD
eukprot:5056491-Pyramimonas_sp.AAC.1